MRDESDALVVCGDFNINMRIPETDNSGGDGDDDDHAGASTNANTNANTKNSKKKGSEESTIRRAGNDRFVFEGVIPHGTRPHEFAPLVFETGFKLEPSLSTAGGGAAGAGAVQVSTESRGRGECRDSNELSARFVWRRGDGTPVTLVDAYDGVSTRAREKDEEEGKEEELGDREMADGSADSGNDKKKKKKRVNKEGALLGSSHNAQRVETIDFLFLDRAHWPNGPQARSSLRTTHPDGTPDEANPSDHIPLIVALPLATCVEPSLG